jgi:uncharacterized repeat protein (TIGR03837 family)
MPWDIFCSVIDNYGDIGVTWRLARQLAAEHGVPVRLWVNDLAAFRRIWPEVDPALAVQQVPVKPAPGFPLWKRGIEGDLQTGGTGCDRQIPPAPPFPKGGEHREATVEVRRWTTPLLEVEPGEVVIEALACDLPEEFVARMAAREPKPVWLNLEYLTAEAWARGVHGLPSPHPRLPLTKYFFMPGYGAGSGGLTREAWLFGRRHAFQADTAARSDFWRGLGLPSEVAGELRVSLFCYENAALPGLLAAWAAGGAPLRALVPVGKVLPEIAAWFGLATPPEPGTILVRDVLTLHVLPMLDQDAYDRLLWACDLNFVRGEDSFVRAQLAARPLVWQAYRQEDEAHFAKLEAFLDLYCAGMDAELADLTRRVWRAWNREAGGGDLWPAWRLALPALERHAQLWCDRLAGQPDTASNLLIFCKKKLE